MKLKLLHSYAASTFYETYFSAKQDRPSTQPILRFDIPFNGIEGRFYIGASDNKDYEYCNTSLKRIL